MSAPSAPIDSSLAPNSKDVYYVLENGSVWKTANLSTAGAATWTECLTVATFQTLAGITNAVFMRIIAATTDLVYVLGAGFTGANGHPWLAKSTDGGSSWSAYKVDTAALTAKPYTMDVSELTLPHPDDSTWIYYYSKSMPNRGDYPDPMFGFGWLQTTAKGSLAADGGSIHYWNTSQGIITRPSFALTAGMSTPQRVLAEGYLDDYFGAGEGVGYDIAWTRTVNRHGTTIARGGINDDPHVSSTGTMLIYMLWNIPSVSMPRAFDVAASNNAWLYVGLNDKIVASEDGGVTWFTFFSVTGANDICVDPLLPGAVYYWSTGGSLNLLVKSAPGGVGTLTNTGLMTETPLDKPLRIARDPSSGKLWGLPNGTTLTMRDGGANSNQQTGLTGATGLHAYAGYKLIFCDSTKIYKSDNSGTNVTDVTGGWSGYSGGVNAHRMPA